MRRQRQRGRGSRRASARRWRHDSGGGTVASGVQRTTAAGGCVADRRRRARRGARELHDAAARRRMHAARGPTADARALSAHPRSRSRRRRERRRGGGGDPRRASRRTAAASAARPHAARVARAGASTQGGGDGHAVRSRTSGRGVDRHWRAAPADAVLVHCGPPTHAALSVEGIRGDLAAATWRRPAGGRAGGGEREGRRGGRLDGGARVASRRGGRGRVLAAASWHVRARRWRRVHGTFRLPRAPRRRRRPPRDAAVGRMSGARCYSLGRDGDARARETRHRSGVRVVGARGSEKRERVLSVSGLLWPETRAGWGWLRT